MATTRRANQEGLRPIAVLLDRSRDLLAARGIVRLEPDDRYHVTDSRVPLTPGRLASYDVLVIAGHAPANYTRREVDAVVRFVRRGGGLLLAGSAGVFERHMHRPAEEMAVAALARRFGIEFLSPARATGRTRADIALVKGYPGESVRVRRCAALRGLRKADAFLRQWSPVRSARRATVLLAHRRTGEAAAVSVRFGRGRIVAIGGTSTLYESHRLCLLLLEHLASGRSKRKRSEALPREILPRYATRRSGNIEIRYARALTDRVPAVLKIARKIVPRFNAMVRGKELTTWRIELHGGCDCRTEWGWGQSVPLIHVGAEAPEPELAFALGACMGRAVGSRTYGGRILWQTVLESPAGDQFAGLTAMRLGGSAEAADRLGAALERESRRRFKGIDAGRYNSYEDNAPGLWIWCELARRYGDDILARFLKAVPEKFDRSAAPEAVFTDLDLVIHFLGRAAEADLFPWFAEQGATVHPLPPERFGGKAFKRGVRRYLRRRVMEFDAPASERADAVEAMIASDDKDKKPLAGAVRQLKSPHAAARLVAATRLLRAGDPRGAPVLQKLARGRADAALAAIAALQLTERGRREAAGRLASLAGKMDHRFQLDAGYQLGRIGDRRAARFSLEGIARADGRAAARLETRYRPGLAVFPTVDREQVAIVYSVDQVAHMPHDTHFSMFYVSWVHTSPKFRRKGLSRLAMQRTMADPLLRRCSCAALHTGTRNVAHAMYRSFGFVDAPPQETLACQLEGAPAPSRQKGIKVRPHRPGDEATTANLFNAFAAETFATGKVHPRRLEPRCITLLAHRGRRPVGYLTAELRGKEEAIIRTMAMNRKAKPDQIARALLGRLHRNLGKRGVKRVHVSYAAAALAPFLQPLGYRSAKTGGIALIALENLPQFFREISPLLERRLGETGWSGTVAVRGERHRAALKIDKGRVAVLSRIPARTDIALSGSDETITQIVTGIETPFEAFLQIKLRIEPMLTARTRGMLEKLLPRLEVHTWLW